MYSKMKCLFLWELLIIIERINNHLSHIVLLNFKMKYEITKFNIFSIIQSVHESMSLMFALNNVVFGGVRFPG